MRILYAATDQMVPGTKGGSIHVMAVARGLAALGHDVHALVTPGAGGVPLDAGVTWHALRPPLGRPQFRLLVSHAVRSIAATLRPDVVMERYYNFGGEGMAAAADRDVPYVLEVNAPVIDHRGSRKRLLDRALVVEPMRRWRERQCRAASLIVTPSATIVPPFVPRDRILQVEWGADTVRFHPGARGAVPFTRQPDKVLVIFAGAFRSWHGAVHLVEAMRLLHERGRRNMSAVLLGDGPELSAARRAGLGLDTIAFTGSVPHEQMPACLAAADIGAAPFDTAAHAALSLDFYWSPLKVFEYMSSGLPVVAPALPRLRQIVADGREGILYDPSVPGGLAAALDRLAEDAGLRRAMGTAGRQRAVAEYGWDVHCRKLDEALRRCVS